MNEVTALVEAEGGRVVGAAVLWLRGKAETPFQVESAIRKQLPDWQAEDCPLCKQGVLVNTLYGHGSEFYALHGYDPKEWSANQRKKRSGKK